MMPRTLVAFFGFAAFLLLTAGACAQSEMEDLPVAQETAVPSGDAVTAPAGGQATALGATGSSRPAPADPVLVRQASRRLPPASLRHPVRSARTYARSLLQPGIYYPTRNPEASVLVDPWTDAANLCGLLRELLGRDDGRLKELAKELGEDLAKTGGGKVPAGLEPAWSAAKRLLEEYAALGDQKSAWYQVEYYKRIYRRKQLERDLKTALPQLAAAIARARAAESAAAGARTPLSRPATWRLPRHLGTGLAAGVLPVVKVTSPSGKTSELRAYPAGDAWEVRLLANEPGKWTVSTRHGDRLEANLSAGGAGLIRVDPTAPTMFARSDGRRFVPVGMNLCWVLEGNTLEERLASWKRYLDRIAGSGQNWVRVWCCPWSMALETKATGAGRYDNEAAAALDQVFELAAERGLYLQLCLEYHGMLAAKNDWGKNPYNAANGGPCKTPGQFFAGATARALFKKRLDYLVARYAAHENLFAWEFFNEVDLSDLPNPCNLIRWHKEMAAYLRGIDPYRHLITTSTAGETVLYAPLWLLSGLDFAQVHVYRHDLARSLPRTIGKVRHFGRPCLAGEAGQDSAWEPYVWETRFDPLAIGLHDALFSGLSGGASGTGMFWWWDNYIGPNDLYKVFPPASKVATWLEASTGRFAPVAGSVRGADGGRVLLHAAGTANRILIWLKDTAFLPTENQPRPTARPAGKLTVTIEAPRGTTWALTRFDTWTGQESTAGTATGSRGGLTFDLAGFERDVAVLAVRK